MPLCVFQTARETLPFVFFYNSHDAAAADLAGAGGGSEGGSRRSSAASTAAAPGRSGAGKAASAKGGAVLAIALALEASPPVAPEGCAGGAGAIVAVGTEKGIVHIARILRGAFVAPEETAAAALVPTASGEADEEDSMEMSLDLANMPAPPERRGETLLRLQVSAHGHCTCHALRGGG